VRLIDSHCHLNYEGLVDRQDEVLASARERGVCGFLNISTRVSEWDDVIAVAERNADVWATVGVHPHEADAHPDLGAAALTMRPRTRASSRSANAGSIIITTSRTARRSASGSKRISRPPRTSGLPLVIHTREAEEDTAAILGKR
jgi:TatD DNase family protein